MEPIINQQISMTEKKNKTWLWIVVIILAAGLTGAGVYYWQNIEAKNLALSAEEKVRSEMQVKITEAENKLAESQNQLITQQKTINDIRQQKSPSNTFDPTTTKVGDEIVNMKISSIGPVNAKEPLDVTQNYKVIFKGQANISGKFYLDEILRDYCISVDQLDWVKLPQSNNDSRAPWLCVTNPDVEAIKKIMSDNNGNTNITIDDYTIYQYPSEASNTATLIKINN